VFLDKILLLGAEKQVLSFQFEVDETSLFIDPFELKIYCNIWHQAFYFKVENLTIAILFFSLKTHDC